MRLRHALSCLGLLLPAACGQLYPGAGPPRGPREPAPSPPPAEQPGAPGHAELGGDWPPPRVFGPPVAGSLRIGLIADCQYADQPDRGQRMYRRSPDKLRAAVAGLNAARPAFSVHLGDFTDDRWESFAVVEPLLRALAAPAFHVLGNHDFAVPDERKEQVPARMGLAARYRAFSQNGWRFLLLDSNDISLHAFPAGSTAQDAARDFRAAWAPQADDSGGGVGLVQLLWLDAELAEADAAGEFAVVMSHHPLLPANPMAVWNAAEVIAVLQAHPCVKLCVAGHNHAGAYAEQNGIHYLTLQGMVDTTDNAWATLDLAPDAMRVDGNGRVPDRELRPR